jgi:hypothetical protein
MEHAMADRKRERDERLAKALRENLKRRKAHQKAVNSAQGGTFGQDAARD